MQKLASIAALVCLIVLCVGGGAAIGISTAGNMSWYDTLNQPSWTPPNWLFGPAWTTLYTLMAISMWLVWRSQAKSCSDNFLPTILFTIQLLLNFLWTPVFFAMHQLGWAMVNIVVLDLAVLATMVAFSKHSRPAVYCLVPYLCWIGFATTLNGGFLWLNGW